MAYHTIVRWRVCIVVCCTLCLPGVAVALEGGYNGGLYVQSDDGNFTLKTNIQVQPQWQLVKTAAGKFSTFQVRRGRVIWSGHAVNPRLTYKLQFEAVGGEGDTVMDAAAQGGPTLRDAYLNYALRPEFQIWFGQGKVPFNREELTSSSKLQFVDRSVSNESFTFARDLGLQLHGVVADQRVEWAVFAFNDGVNRNRRNSNDEFLLGARAVWHVLGHHGYAMSDVDQSAAPQLAWGVAGNYNRLGVGEAASGAEATVYAATTDVAFKWAGWSAHIEGHWLKDATSRQTVYGGLAQFGYFIMPEHLEVVARGAAVLPKGATKGYEFGGGVNYFFQGHRLKIQTDYAFLKNSYLVGNATDDPIHYSENGGATASNFVAGQNDHRLRTQVQLYF